MTTMAAQSRSKTLISDFAKEIWESTVLHGQCITLVSRLSEIAAVSGHAVIKSSRFALSSHLKNGRF